MKYRLKWNEDIVEVLASQPEGKPNLLISTGDETHEVMPTGRLNHCHHLVVDGKSTMAYVAQRDRGKHIFLNGQSFFLEDADKGATPRKKRGAPEDSPSEVTPPMPAVVTRILVEEGDPVEKGQGLIVVTAMKMETTLKSPKHGLVVKINTSVNAKVSPGEILVEIQEKGAEDEPRPDL